MNEIDIENLSVCSMNKLSNLLQNKLIISVLGFNANTNIMVIYKYLYIEL